MSKNKKALFAVFAILGIVAVGLTAAVFAKYISSIEATATAKVAKWAFSTDNTSGTVTCTLEDSVDASTLVAGTIAPGTSGKCPITVSNENSEVDITYEITLGTITNKPTNLEFYTDAAHQHPLNAQNTISGSLKAGATMENPEYVYWNWAYETTGGDAADIADGKNGNTMTMVFNVTGTQVNPSN
jgi:hypothetical protein